MSEERKYVLELTAEELEWIGPACPSAAVSLKADTRSVDAKLRMLREMARADRKADELRLPWRVVMQGGDDSIPAVVCDEGFVAHLGVHANRLMAAAPELRDLADAVETWWSVAGIDNNMTSKVWRSFCDSVVPKLARARRKMATGKPEGG